jgi:hypothetical protein
MSQITHVEIGQRYATAKQVEQCLEEVTSLASLQQYQDHLAMMRHSFDPTRPECGARHAQILAIVERNMILTGGLIRERMAQRKMPALGLNSINLNAQAPLRFSAFP